MAGDAHEDPYRAQRRPIILTCAECGEVGPVTAFRQPEDASGQSIDLPLEPLCTDCTAIERRVWGERRLPGIGQPPEKARIVTEAGEVWYAVLCFRCGGAGTVLGGQCFQCRGQRWSWVNENNIRRVARWSQTFQQNRVPD